MRDHDDGAISEAVCKPSHDFVFSRCVHIAGGFVQQHDLRITSQCARQNERLLLTAG